MRGALVAHSADKGLDIGRNFVQEILANPGKPAALEFGGTGQRVGAHSRLIEEPSRS